MQFRWNIELMISVWECFRQRIAARIFLLDQIWFFVCLTTSFVAWQWVKQLDTVFLRASQKRCQHAQPILLMFCDWPKLLTIFYWCLVSPQFYVHKTLVVLNNQMVTWVLITFFLLGECHQSQVNQTADWDLLNIDQHQPADSYRYW